MTRSTDDLQQAVVSPGPCAELPTLAGRTPGAARRELDRDARRFRKLCDEQAGLMALTGTFTV